jgi:hypothetical protein
VQDLDAVHEDVLPMFEEVAKKLIAERGDVRALAQSLACLTGYTVCLSLSLSPSLSRSLACGMWRRSSVPLLDAHHLILPV